MLLRSLSVGLAPDPLLGSTERLAAHDFLVRPLALDPSGKIAGEGSKMVNDPDLHVAESMRLAWCWLR